MASNAYLCDLCALCGSTSYVPPTPACRSSQPRGRDVFGTRTDAKGFATEGTEATEEVEEIMRNKLTEKFIGAAIEVHRVLGPVVE